MKKEWKQQQQGNCMAGECRNMTVSLLFFAIISYGQCAAIAETGR
ncbi:hypothetical protein FLA_1529 [Filimonas lacunae]|nr:hypothetical protein FLA_1529 [Filimonas lacunae]